MWGQFTLDTSDAIRLSPAHGKARQQTFDEDAPPQEPEKIEGAPEEEVLREARGKEPRRRCQDPRDQEDGGRPQGVGHSLVPDAREAIRKGQGYVTSGSLRDSDLPLKPKRPEESP